MRLVVRGDLHLDLVSDGLSRLEEQKRIVLHTLEVLESVRPDVFVDLGDLFDRTRPSPSAYAEALSYASALALWEKETHSGTTERTYILAGNHDKPSRGDVSALHPLERLSFYGAGFSRVVLMPELVEFEGTSLLFLPYVTDWEAKREAPIYDGPARSAQEYLDRFVHRALVKAERVVAFTHLEVPGSKLADDDRVQRDVGTAIPGELLESPKVVRVYAGHVHKYQELKKVTVVGSALHVDFGEAADPKGLIVAEV